MEFNIFNFNNYPLWFNYIFSLSVILSSGFIGSKLSTIWKPKDSSSNQNSLLVGAMLGLLSFLLAFTFSLSANRFDNRKTSLLEQVNGIGTAYLRADLLPEPMQGEIKSLLCDYVNILSQLADDQYNIEELNIQSEDIQAQIWEKIAKLPNENIAPALISFVADSMNSVFDQHTKRYTIGVKYQIPDPIWVFFYIVIGLSIVAVGYYSTELSMKVSPILAIILALTFSAVIYMIADLDNRNEGFLQVNQEPMVQLRQQLMSKQKL